MKKSKLLIYSGSSILILMSLLYLTLNNIPEFFMGLLFGIGISLVLLGIYLRNHNLDCVKKVKRNLVHKFIKR